MTNEQQIKALAELDGWDVERGYHPAFGYNAITNKGWPDYLTSYDAIIPLVQKQTDTMQYKIFCKVGDVAKQQQLYQIFQATPAQLCEALLRATGKWIE